jgi:hypothetical protein
MISGGNWNNGTIAGVWAANLNNYRTNSNNNVGFRSDSGFPSNSERGNSGATGILLSCRMAKSTGRLFLVAIAKIRGGQP